MQKGWPLLFVGLGLPHIAWACDEEVVGQVHGEHRPIAGVRVVLGPSTTLTGEDGHFRITEVCPGSHPLEVLHPAFEPWSSRVSVPTTPLDIQLAEDIEVVEVHAPTAADRDTHARTTIEGATLERQRGQDLGEILESVTGVTLLRTGADATRPMVRGFYGRRLLLLQDGMRHESQKWGDGHAPELDPMAAGSITVVRGAAGVRYGPDAIGGVVLLTSPDLRSDAGVGGRIDLGTATNGRKALAGLQLDLSDGNGLAVRVQGNFAASAALTAPNHVLGNTASRLGNFAVRVGTNREAYQLDVGFRHHSFLAGICYCTRASNPDELRAILANGQAVSADLWQADRDLDRPYQAVHHDTLYATFRRHVGFGLLEARYNTQLNRRLEYKEAREDITGPQFDFTLLTHTLDVALTHDPLDVGPWTLEGELGGNASLQENIVDGLPLVPNHRAYGIGAFAIERLYLGNGLLEAGARVDHQTRTTYLTDSAYYRHEARETIQDVDCTLLDGSARCANAWTTASMSLGAVWRDPTEQLGLRLDVSSANRFPDGDELYLNGFAPSQPVFGLGDPGLRTERTYSASPTVSLDLPFLLVELAAYANRIDDTIVFGPVLTDEGTPAIDATTRGSFLRYSFRQTDSVQWGLEGEVNLRVGPHVTARFSGSRIRAAERKTGAYLPFIPPDQGSAGIALHGTGRFEGTRLAVDAVHIARQNRFSDATDLIDPPDAVTRIDAAFDLPLRRGDHELRLGLSATNLLDTPIRTYTSLLRPFSDEPGRDVRLRASMPF